MSAEKRRLAGILAADVVGYSAMVATDELATLACVRALRAEIIEPAAAAHDGRLFKTMGDGFLLEFASAVQTLRCAIAIQTTLNAQTDGLRLRIGVHQGEVVPEGDDLLGDGVIVAARLEPMAEPGGIVISSRVKEDAAGKMALEVDDLGEPELKNRAAKIRAYRVRLAAPAAAPVQAVLALPDKPSVAVLPFQNMSGDLEQEYFADGMVEEIITALSCIRWLFVIARNSSFTYKGRVVDIKQVGRELGVRYVLEGSVRKGGDRVRIAAQLIDAITGTHVWAGRYDRDIRCLIPDFDGAVFSREWKEALWGQVLHGSATTTAAVRRAIQHSQESLRVLAKRYGINPKTVAKWKQRGSVTDRPTGPREPRSTVLSMEDEAIIVAFRQHTLLPLDDCLYALQATIPRLTRSSLHRCLQRHGIGRLPEVQGNKPIRKAFKAYPIGFFHIDIAEVQTAEGKLYLFVAIDRTSKFAFTALHVKATTRTAADFLRALVKAVPYKIHTVLTDNGIHFTDPKGETWTPVEIRQMIACKELFRAHAFEYACALADIDHRLTKPKHPWTNGQVERMNRTIKDATVRRFHYDAHDQFSNHLADFVQAYNFAKRLKTLKGLTPYEFICKAWTNQPERFTLNPLHQMPGLNI